jgi:hypothetical protein
MPKVTRREVLTGIAGCSAAAAFGCKKESPESADRVQMALKTNFTKLNVLIHGLSAMVIDNSGIHLYMPSFIDPRNPDMSHRYLFGNLVYTLHKELGQMQSMGPRDVCTLSGVTAGSRPKPSSFDSNLNLIFQGASVTCADCRQFNLPWTDQIQAVAVIHRADNAKLMTDACGTGYGNTKKLSSICVLSYDLKDTDQPQIMYDDASNTGWSLQQCGDLNYPTYANLHIFAEPKDADSDHAISGFKKLMGNIGKTCLSFDPFVGIKMIQDNDNPPPKGTLQAFDLRHLGDFRGGEVANCVSAVIFP